MLAVKVNDIIGLVENLMDKKMPKAYSVDLRERIVEAYRGAGLTADEVAKQYRVGQKTVYRYAEMDAATGDLTPGKPPGRTPTVGEKNTQLLESWCGISRTLSLKNYARRLEKQPVNGWAFQLCAKFARS